MIWNNLKYEVQSAPNSALMCKGQEGQAYLNKMLTGKDESLAFWFFYFFYKQFSKQYDIEKVQSSSKVVIKKKKKKSTINLEGQGLCCSHCLMCKRM